jgi:hypothetical protein
MASGWYNKGKAQVANGGIDLLTDTIKVMLVSSAYTFNPDHNFASDANAQEIAVTGYTGGFGGGGRKTLANKTITEDDTNDRAVFDADDPVWTALGAGATIGGAILLKEVTNDGASPVILFLDPADLPTNGSDFQLQFDATGIAWLT